MNPDSGLFLAFGAIVLVLVLAILGLSYILGQRHKDRAAPW